MRVNIYAEEMTDRIEIITKDVEGSKFTALRFYLELPCTIQSTSESGDTTFHKIRGPFTNPGNCNDDSAAVTFWGKRDLRVLLRKAIAILDDHYGVPVEEEE